MPMDDEELALLRDAARDWSRDNAPVSALRRFRDRGGDPGGFDQALFAQVVEMGFAGMMIDEAHGGSDAGIRGFCAVMEEFGRHLVAVPLVGNALLVPLALRCAGSAAQKSAWLPAIAGGSLVAGFAVDEGVRHAPQEIRLEAVSYQGGIKLTGAKTTVPEGMGAGIFLVAARDADGPVLAMVPAAAPGLTRKPCLMMDSRGYADLILADVEVPAEAILAKGEAAQALLDYLLDCARVAVSAEAYGLAREAFDVTLDYLKTRVQFDHPIGSFQALQHRAAEMFTAIQVCRGVLDAAVLAVDQDSDDRAELVAICKALVADLANHVTREMIQMHGGIGVTDAHDAGFYLKRARVLEASFGSAALHRERFGRMRGI